MGLPQKSTFAFGEVVMVFSGWALYPLYSMGLSCIWVCDVSLENELNTCAASWDE